MNPPSSINKSWVLKTFCLPLFQRVGDLIPMQHRENDTLQGNWLPYPTDMEAGKVIFQTTWKENH